MSEPAPPRKPLPDVAERPVGMATGALDGGELPFDERLEVPGGLRRRAARGTIVNSAFQIGLGLLNLVQRFAVVSFLTAAEFGFWGILVITLGTLLWLKWVGISDKYIQQAEADQELAYQKAFSFELVYTLALWVLMIAVLPVYAVIYGRWEIIVPGIILSLAVPVSAFQTPTWVFYKRMDFVRQRTLSAVTPVTTAILTIGLAIAGLGYWSLIIGAVVGNLTGAVVAAAASPYRIRFHWDRGALREYVSFSWPLLLTTGSGLVLVQVATIVGEDSVGLAGVGVIGVAGIISGFADHVNRIVTQTIYPVICRVQDQLALLAEAFVKTNRLALMWGMPYGVALILFGPDLVTYVLGEKWRAAVPVIQVLGVVSALKEIAFNWSAFIRARGDTRPLAVEGFASMIAFVATGVPLMYSIGVVGFALGFVATTLVQIAIRTYYLERMFAGFAMYRHIVRAALPVLPAAGAVLALRALDSGLPAAAGAAVEVVAFAVVTALATYALERRLITELLGYLRGARGASAGFASA